MSITNLLHTERNITPSEFSAFRTISPPNANSISPPPLTPNRDIDPYAPFNIGEDAYFLAQVTIRDGEVALMEPEPCLANAEFFKMYGDRCDPQAKVRALPNGRTVIVVYDDPILPGEVQK